MIVATVQVNCQQQTSRFKQNAAGMIAVQRARGLRSRRHFDDAGELIAQKSPPADDSARVAIARRTSSANRGHSSIMRSSAESTVSAPHFAPPSKKSAYFPGPRAMLRFPSTPVFCLHRLSIGRNRRQLDDLQQPSFQLFQRQLGLQFLAVALSNDVIEMQWLSVKPTTIPATTFCVRGCALSVRVARSGTAAV